MAFFHGKKPENDWFLPLAVLALLSRIGTSIEEGIIVGEKPDADDVVALCKARGYRLGVLSNTCELHVEQFESLGFFEHLPAEYRVYSHRERVLKPDISAYRCFEERVAAESSSILFFDDTPENISVAKELGWHAFLYSARRSSLASFERALAGFE